jgi:hypothetical protein
MFSSLRELFDNFIGMLPSKKPAECEHAMPEAHGTADAARLKRNSCNFLPLWRWRSPVTPLS